MIIARKSIFFLVVNSNFAYVEAVGRGVLPTGLIQRCAGAAGVLFSCGGCLPIRKSNIGFRKDRLPVNRHERRKATKIMKLELRTFPIEELRQMGTVCAHEDCAASFHGDMPEGWRWVISYFDPIPTMPDWSRDEWVRRPYLDVALCPEHGRQLESSYKGSAARELISKPVAGAA
jgi:hypothetical protein